MQWWTACETWEYQIVAFETGYEFTTLDDTDTLYPAPKSGISDFELALLRSTALALLDDAGMFKEIYPTAAQNRRDMVLYQLKTLKDLPSLPGPKFVFAHLLIPHWPFVFGPNGESLIGPNLTQSEGVGDKAYFDAYRGQGLNESNMGAFLFQRIRHTIAKGFLQRLSILRRAAAVIE